MLGSEKSEEKCKEKKIQRKSKKKGKIKNKLKVDKLFLFVTSNSFYLFELIHIKIK